MVDPNEIKHLKITDKECELLRLAVINYMSLINAKGNSPYLKYYDQLEKLERDLLNKWVSFAK